MLKETVFGVSQGVLMVQFIQQKITITSEVNSETVQENRRECRQAVLLCCMGIFFRNVLHSNTHEAGSSLTTFRTVQISLQPTATSLPT